MAEPTAVPFNKPRRKDRAVEDERWIVGLLTRCPVGTLGTLGPDGPALNPNLFAFDASVPAIYIHTAHKGQTRSNVENDSRVAFTVFELGRLLPAAAAVDFSAEYSAVVINGTCSIVEDHHEARRALELLMRKYAPHLEPDRDYRGIGNHDLARTSVFRVDIRSWSGKGKTVETSNAYEYSAVKSPARREPAHCDRGFTSALSSSFGEASWAAIRARNRKMD